MAEVGIGVGPLERLSGILIGLDRPAIAVSGGVDSLTLAALAGRVMGQRVRMVHAVSPAVPPEATTRTRDLATREGWQLEIVDAGEFQSEEYLANPYNRCFFCKTHLYGEVARRHAGTVCSGTNLDDLVDWRPGLEAARNHAVRHPFVEAEVTKAGVRRLAADLGLGEISELPASPCLSSRIETGVRIDAETLSAVHACETLVAKIVGGGTVRCRVRRDGVVIELAAATLDALAPARRDDLVTAITDRLRERGLEQSVRLAPYRMGSAFVAARNQ